MQKVFLVLLTSLWVSISCTASESFPEFSDYPVSKFTDKAVPVELTTEQEQMFRTRLTDASKQPIDFAGEHVLAYWGCGASCTVAAAVSVKTGQVAFFPGTICCNQSDFNKLDYKLESNLLIVTGYINEDGVYGRHYYVLRDNDFVYLRTQQLTEFPTKDDN